MSTKGISWVIWPSVPRLPWQRMTCTFPVLPHGWVIATTRTATWRTIRGGLFDRLHIETQGKQFENNRRNFTGPFSFAPRRQEKLQLFRFHYDSKRKIRSCRSPGHRNFGKHAIQKSRTRRLRPSAGDHSPGPRANGAARQPAMARRIPSGRRRQARHRSGQRLRTVPA